MTACGLLQCRKITSTARNEVTSTLAYLIAVPDRIFGPLYDQSIFDELERDDSAKTVRCLSTVRNILLMQNGAIGNHIRRNLYGNIDEFIAPEVLDYLETRGIQLVTPCPRVNDIIRRLNLLIPERVEECKDLFPGIEWRFVRRLFTMKASRNEFQTETLISAEIGVTLT